MTDTSKAMAGSSSNQKNSMPPPNATSLRHTLDPYLFRAIIFGLLLIWFLFFWFKTGQPMPALVGLAVFAYFAIKSYFYDNRYSVWYDQTTIFMHPAMFWRAPAFMTTIKYSDITSVHRETSDPRTLLAGIRPSRRIAIYADNVPPPNIIDVSLKHFNHDDIKELIRRVHEERPDLAIPADWL